MSRLEIHYSDVIMGAMASQIASLTIVYSPIYSGADQRKHQSSSHWPLWGRWPVNSPHKRPVMRKKFPFDDVIVFYDFNEFKFPLIRQFHRINIHMTDDRLLGLLHLPRPDKNKNTGDFFWRTPFFSQPSVILWNVINNRSKVEAFL